MTDPNPMSAGFTLSEAIEACETAIALNESACVDRVGRIALACQTMVLRRHLDRARKEAASRFGIQHLFGPNWLGPALDDALKTSAFHREHSRPVTIQPLPRVTTPVRKLDPNVWGDLEEAAE